MFTRINTNLQVTVFDTSDMDISTKLELFNKSIEMHKESLKSLSNIDEITRLVIPAIFSTNHLKLHTCGMTAKDCLFNDILGTHKAVNRQTFGQTRIIDNNYASWTQKRRSRTDKVSPSDSNTVLVTENRAMDLINKHHKKFVKSSEKSLTSITRHNDGSYSEGQYNRGIIERLVLNIEDLTNYTKGSSTNLNQFMLKDIDRVLFVDTVYSLSEMNIPIEHMYSLYRMTASGFNHEFNMFNNAPDIRTQMVNLYTKYGIKAGHIWKRNVEDREGISNVENNRSRGYDALFDENEDHLNTEKNIFVPVTYILFLCKGSTLFLPSTSIIREEHVINNPRFFVSKYSVAGNIGTPEYYNFSHSDKSSIKNKPYTKAQSDIFDKLTTNLYSTKTILTSIPANFTTRLLKSKLKSVNNYVVEKKVYDDYTYAIPKSILGAELMSSFHFFSTKQEEEIEKQSDSNANCFYCVRFDDRVDLSYYTFHMHLWLVNNFADDYYSRYLTLDDIIGYPKILSSNLIDIETLYNEVETRQNHLAEKFNSLSCTLLSKEMFAYERANLLLPYLLTKINLKLFSINRRDWNSDDEITAFKPLEKNGYMFTREVMQKFVQERMSDTLFINSTKTYLMETLFRMIMELPKGELYVTIEIAIKEANKAIEKQVKSFISKQKIGDTIVKLLLDRHAVHNIRDVFERSFNKNKNVFNGNLTIFYVLSKERSTELLPMLFTSIFMYNFTMNLAKNMKIFINFLRIYSELPCEKPSIIDEKGKSTMFLSDAVIQKAIIVHYKSWCDSGTRNIKLLKTMFENNIAKKEEAVDNLHDFINLFVDTFTNEYIGIRN